VTWDAREIAGKENIMAEHPNAVWGREMWAAMLAGDMATVAEAFADDIEWHEIGRVEPRRGKAAVAESFATADYEVVPTLVDMVASDDHVVTIVESVATRNGRTLRYRVAEVMRLRDGKIAERWAYSDDTATIAEFFA
jgi:ketosteroid isomerase-like protein